MMDDNFCGPAGREGRDHTELADAAQRQWSRRDEPSWRDDQLPANPVPPADFPRLDVGNAFEREPPALHYVLPGYVAGSVGSIVAAGATGKSMLALQIAVHLAGGHDTLAMTGLAGWTPTPGRVLYLSGEDPEDVLSQRLHAIGKHLGEKERALAASNLHAAPLVGLGARIDDTSWRLRIETEAAGCDLVIVDTLRRFHAGDENSSGEMAMLLSTIEGVCRRAGASVLFLHHISKAAALNGAGEQQASRGSSVLTDNVRWQANLSTMSQAEAASIQMPDAARRLYVRLGFAKINYGPPIEDRWFRRSAGGVLLPEPVIAAALAAVAAAKAAGAAGKGGGRGRGAAVQAPAANDLPGDGDVPMDGIDTAPMAPGIDDDVRRPVKPVRWKGGNRV